MRRIRRLVMQPGLVAVLVGSIALTAGAEDSDEPPGNEPPCPPSSAPCTPASGGEVIDLWGTPPRVGQDVVLGERDLARGNAANLGEVILAIPGVSAVRRAASAIDPVFRGLSGERVATWLGPVPIHGACPSRMDPSVTLLSPRAAVTVEIDRWPGTVTQGPDGTAGRIVVSPDFERHDAAATELHGFVGGGFESARTGYQGFAGVDGGTRHLDFRTTVEWLRFGDYESASGLTVPSHLSRGGATLAMGARPATNQRVWGAVLVTRESDVDFPALPMDIDRSNAWLGNLGYRRLPPRGALRRLDASAGFAFVDHRMSNRDRPNRSTLEAETPSTSLSLGSRLGVTLRLGPRTWLTTGLDGFVVRKDATRTRHLVGPDQTFYDHLWPDTTQWDAGGYGEVGHTVTENLRVRAGARADLVVSRAAAADDPSLGGLTVREQYAAYYGGEAADTDRAQATGAGVAALRWTLAPGLTVTADTGLSMRTAGMTERYFAFGATSGGFQVGNPTLGAEKKWDVTLGLEHHRPWIDATAAGFLSWVDDHILPLEIDRRDVDGDGVDDRIQGYRNVSARLVGIELAAELALPGRPLSLALDLSYVRGRNLTQGKPLPEIPPLAGRAVLRYRAAGSRAWWIEAGPRFAARQRRVDTAYPEDESPGFVTASARAGLQVARLVRVEIGVDNLLDADYHEHLDREAPGAVGDLVAGDEIPAPGRNLSLTVASRW